MKVDIVIAIRLTWSKIIAVLILILAFVMDFKSSRNGTVFMYALPFVIFLITGKQYLDTKTPTQNTENNGNKD